MSVEIIPIYRDWIDQKNPQIVRDFISDRIKEIKQFQESKILSIYDWNLEDIVSRYDHIKEDYKHLDSISDGLNTYINNIDSLITKINEINIPIKYITPVKVKEVFDALDNLKLDIFNSSLESRYITTINKGCIIVNSLKTIIIELDSQNIDNMKRQLSNILTDMNDINKFGIIYPNIHHKLDEYIKFMYSEIEKEEIDYKQIYNITIELRDITDKCINVIRKEQTYYYDIQNKVLRTRKHTYFDDSLKQIVECQTTDNLQYIRTILQNYQYRDIDITNFNQAIGDKNLPDIESLSRLDLFILSNPGISDSAEVSIENIEHTLLYKYQLYKSFKNLKFYDDDLIKDPIVNPVNLPKLFRCRPKIVVLDTLFYTFGLIIALSSIVMLYVDIPDYISYITYQELTMEDLIKIMFIFGVIIGIIRSYYDLLNRRNNYCPSSIYQNKCLGDFRYNFHILISIITNIDSYHNSDKFENSEDRIAYMISFIGKRFEKIMTKFR
jgi:hypothetical protein